MQIHPKGHEGQAPKEFGIDANILKTRTFNLTVARNLEQIEIGGSCLWAISATSLGASIDVYVNDQLRDPITFQQGMFIRGIPFSRIYVSHAAQPGETITLFFAVEEDVNNIQIENPAIAFTEVELVKATEFRNNNDLILLPGVATLILAAAAAHRDIYISSLSTNTAILRLGPSPLATRGIPLAPGETLVIKTTTQITGFNPAAINQIVTTVWTED